MIDLHYWPTPNGKKVTILLEEADIEYRLVECNIGRGDQFEAGFLGISPNNRMPALIDHNPADGGEPKSVFESGAMMMYLAERRVRPQPQPHWRRSGAGSRRALGTGPTPGGAGPPVGVWGVATIPRIPSGSVTAKSWISAKASI